MVYQGAFEVLHMLGPWNFKECPPYLWHCHILADRTKIMGCAIDSVVIFAQQSVSVDNAVELRQVHTGSDHNGTHSEANQLHSTNFSHLQAYTYAELVAATDNFSSQALIGEGGFGKVYRGKLLEMPVAIKRLEHHSMQGQDELYRELEVLGTISHRHLVNLYGWCQEGRCLVYELCERGSLEDCLPQLRWNDRVRVAAEVCRALLFLHKRKPNGVIHRDIKPSNVLLDHYWNAKLADVGLGKILCHSGLESVQRDASCVKASLVGTYAYMDPEYMRTGQVSFSSDIFSLGMLLLQMITGKSTRDVDILDFVESAVVKKNGSFVDRAAGEWPTAHAVAFAKLALQCTEDRKSKRPDLEREILPILKKLHDQCTANDVEDTSNQDQILCVVCMDAAITHAFLPCGHRCVCKHDGIALMMREQPCPICRTQATDVVQIY